MSSMVLKLFVSTMVLFVLARGPLVWAQDAAPEEEGSEDLPIYIESVTVTAEKREDQLQKVPISMTVVDEARIDEAGVQSIQDLQRITPSLVVSTNASYGQPFIRGVGTDLVAIGTESSVAVYVDGIYRGRTTAGILDMFDVERVEILKGPQGTLYGRNATGGAINVVTSAPEAGFSTGGDLAFGSEGYWRLRGTVNAQFGEQLFSRISILAGENDGFIDNLVSGESSDFQDLQAIRAQLFSLSRGSFSARFGLDYARDKGERNLAPKLDPNDLGLAPDQGAIEPEGDRDVRYNTDPSSELEQWTLSAHLSWDWDRMRLVSITAYHEDDLQNELDADASEAPVLDTRTWLTAEAFSQELQLVSRHDGPTDWVVGLFYFQEDADQTVDIVLPLFTPPGVVAPFSRPEAVNEVTAYAVYGQVDHAFSDTFEVFGGLRYSYEEKNHELELLSLGSSVGVFPDEDDWGAWTPRLGFNVDLDEDARFFVSVARGFKSGGFNSTDTSPPVDAFDPEFLWSYEAGLKSTLFDRRLRANISAFYYDYTDLQVNLFDGLAIATIDNAAKAEIQGLELDFLARPAPSFDVDLAVTFLEGEYDRYIASVPGSDLLDLSGNRMPRAPEFSLNLGVHYRHLFPDLGRLTLYGAYRHQSEVFYDQLESSLVGQDDFDVFDARISLEGLTRGWHVAFFGRNLTDELYAHNKIRVAGLTGTLQFFEAPRVYGVEVGFKP